MQSKVCYKYGNFHIEIHTEIVPNTLNIYCVVTESKRKTSKRSKNKRTKKNSTKKRSRRQEQEDTGILRIPVFLCSKKQMKFIFKLCCRCIELSIDG